MISQYCLYCSCISYAENMKYNCVRGKIEALACGGGCLMWPAGARLPNAQQSVAQATTIRPCSCAIVRIYLYTIVCIACAIVVRIPLHDCIYYKCNCVHSWTSLCAHTNAQCSLNTMPKIWAALNHSQSGLFCAHIA